MSMEDLKAIRVVQGTKISHDYDGKDVRTFGYKDLMRSGVPAIGIPGEQNGLVIVDVDGLSDDHKHDGRAWWAEFAEKAGIPTTYKVFTPSGGFHLYFRLPVGINPTLFSPPGKLIDGVDIKYRGWVKAPPTVGYQPQGSPLDIVEAPPSLLAEMERVKGSAPLNMGAQDPYEALRSLANPFSEGQIKELRKRIEWLQASGSLSRDEWRDGIFSMKAGVEDPDILDELVVKWTMNQSYQPGDEDEAREIAARAETHGPVGPGTIFAILKNIAVREGATIQASPYTRQEIIDKSKVKITVSSDGNVKIAPTESNVASLIGAMFDSNNLFHDIRMDNYVFENEVFSDTDLANKIAPMIQSPSFGLGFENIKKAMVLGGIEVLMAARQVDPHRRWLESIEWDGVNRVDTFFSDFASVENSQYNRTVSKILWLALAARGIAPGIKFDNLVILEGPEGARKSTLCELLGGEYYMSLSSKEDINSPDLLRRMHQSSVVELPELVGLIGKSGEEIKAVLATRKDNMRALYSKKGVVKPRGFICMGTTNSARYLNADMGYRRFLPIKIPGGVCQIDTDGISQNREQLFAEAVHRFKAGEDFWTSPLELKKQINKRVREEPLMEPVRDIIKNSFAPMKLTEVFRQLEAEGYISKNLTHITAGRIELALDAVGAVETMHQGTRKWEMPGESIVEQQQQFTEIPTQQPQGAMSFI